MPQLKGDGPATCSPKVRVVLPTDLDDGGRGRPPDASSTSSTSPTPGHHDPPTPTRDDPET